MEADVLTSVFMSMATAPMPTIVTTKFDIAMCVCVSVCLVPIACLFLGKAGCAASVPM